MSTVAYEVQRYTVDRWLPDEKGPGVVLAFMQDGDDTQLHICVSEPMAWQIASRILALLDMEPIRPGEEGFEKI